MSESEKFKDLAAAFLETYGQIVSTTAGGRVGDPDDPDFNPEAVGRLDSGEYGLNDVNRGGAFVPFEGTQSSVSTPQYRIGQHIHTAETDEEQATFEIAYVDFLNTNFNYAAGPSWAIPTPYWNLSFASQAYSTNENLKSYNEYAVVTTRNDNLDSESDRRDCEAADGEFSDFDAPNLMEQETREAKCRFSQKEQAEEEIDAFCGDRSEKDGPCDGAPLSEVRPREIPCDGCSAYPDIEYIAVDDNAETLITRYTKHPMESSLCDLGTTGIISLKWVKDESSCPDPCPPEEEEEEEGDGEDDENDNDDDDDQAETEDESQNESDDLPLNEGTTECSGDSDCPPGSTCVQFSDEEPGVCLTQVEYDSVFGDSGNSSSGEGSASDNVEPEEECASEEEVASCEQQKRRENTGMCWCSDYICDANCDGRPNGYFEYGPGGNQKYGDDATPRCYDACAFYRFNKPAYLANSISVPADSKFQTESPGPLDASEFQTCVDTTTALTPEQEEERQALIDDEGLAPADAERRVRENAATNINAIIVQEYQVHPPNDSPQGPKTSAIHGEMSVHVGEQWFTHSGKHDEAGGCFSVEGEFESGGDDVIPSKVCVHPKKDPTTNEIADNSTIKNFHGVYEETTVHPAGLSTEITIQSEGNTETIDSVVYKQTRTLKDVEGFDNAPQAGEDFEYFLFWSGHRWEIADCKNNQRIIVAKTPFAVNQDSVPECGNGSPVSQSHVATCWHVNDGTKAPVFVLFGDCDSIPGGGFIEGIHVSFMMNIADNVMLVGDDYEEGVSEETEYFGLTGRFPIQGVVTKGSLLEYNHQSGAFKFEGEWGVFWQPCIDEEPVVPPPPLTSEGFESSSQDDIRGPDYSAAKNMFNGNLTLQPFDEEAGLKADVEYASKIVDVSKGLCVSFNVLKTRVRTTGPDQPSIAEGIITKGSAIYSSDEISSFSGEWGIFNISETQTQESKILFAVNTPNGIFTEFININHSRNYRIQFSISPNFSDNGEPSDGGTCYIKLAKLRVNIPISQRENFSNSSKYIIEEEKQFTYTGDIASSNDKILMGLNASTDNSSLGSSAEAFNITSLNIHEGPADSDIYTTSISGARTIKDSSQSRTEHNSLIQKSSLTDLESFNKSLLDNIHGDEESGFFDSSFSPSTSNGTGVSACFELLAQTADFLHYEKLINENNFYDTIVSKGVYTPSSRRHLNFNKNFISKDDPIYSDFDIEWGIFFNAREPFSSPNNKNKRLNLFFAVKTDSGLYYERAYVDFNALYACCFAVNPSKKTFGFRLLDSSQCYENQTKSKTCPIRIYPQGTTRPEFEDGAPYSGNLKSTNEPAQILPDLGNSNYYSNAFADWSIRNISFSKNPKCICDVESFSMSTSKKDEDLFYPEPKTFNGTYKNGICITAKIKRKVDISCTTTGNSFYEPINLISKGKVSQFLSTQKVSIEGEYSLFAKSVCNNKTQNLFFGVNSSKGMVSIPVGSDGKIAAGHWYDIMINISPKDEQTGKVNITTKYIRDRHGDRKELNSNFVSQNTKEFAADFEFKEDSNYDFNIGTGFLEGEKYLITDVNVFESCDISYGGFGATSENLSFDKGKVGNGEIKVEATAPATKKKIDAKLSYNFTKFNRANDGAFIFSELSGSNLAMYDQSNLYSGFPSFSFIDGYSLQTNQGINMKGRPSSQSGFSSGPFGNNDEPIGFPPSPIPSNSTIFGITVACSCDSGDTAGDVFADNSHINGFYSFVGHFQRPGGPTSGPEHGLVIGDGETKNFTFGKEFYSFDGRSLPNSMDPDFNWNDKNTDYFNYSNTPDCTGQNRCPKKGYAHPPIFYKEQDDDFSHSVVITAFGINQYMGSSRLFKHYSWYDINAEPPAAKKEALNSKNVALGWQIIQWKGDGAPETNWGSDGRNSIYNPANYGKVYAESELRENFECPFTLGGLSQSRDLIEEYSKADKDKKWVKKDGKYSNWTFKNQPCRAAGATEAKHSLVLYPNNNSIDAKEIACQGKDGTSDPCEKPCTEDYDCKGFGTETCGDDGCCEDEYDPIEDGDCGCAPGASGSDGNVQGEGLHLTMSNWTGMKDAISKSCSGAVADDNVANGRWDAVPAGDDRRITQSELEAGMPGGPISGSIIHPTRCQWERYVTTDKGKVRLVLISGSGFAASRAGSGGEGISPPGSCPNVDGTDETWYMIVDGTKSEGVPGLKVAFLAVYGVAEAIGGFQCPNFTDICRTCKHPNGQLFSSANNVNSETGAKFTPTEGGVQDCWAKEGEYEHDADGNEATPGETRTGQGLKYWGGAWLYIYRGVGNPNNPILNYIDIVCDCEGDEDTGPCKECDPDDGTPCPDGQECKPDGEGKHCCVDSQDPPNPNPPAFTQCKKGRLIFCAGSDGVVYTHEMETATNDQGDNASPWRRISMQIRNPERVQSANEGNDTKPGEILISVRKLEGSGRTDLTNIDELAPTFQKEIFDRIPIAENHSFIIGYNDAGEEVWGQDDDGRDINDDIEFDPASGGIINVCRDDDEDGVATNTPTAFPNALGWNSNVVFLDDVRVTKELCEFGSGGQRLDAQGLEESLSLFPGETSLENDPCNEESTTTTPDGVNYEDSPAQPNFAMPVNPCYIPVMPKCGDTLFLRQRDTTDPNTSSPACFSAMPSAIAGPPCVWEFARSMDCFDDKCLPNKSEQDDGFYRAALTRGEFMNMTDAEILDIFDNQISQEEREEAERGDWVTQDAGGDFKALSTIGELLEWADTQFGGDFSTFLQDTVNTDGIGGNASDINGGLLDDVDDDGNNNTSINNWFDYVDSESDNQDALDALFGPLAEMQDITSPVDIIADFLATRTCYNIPASEIEDKHRKCIDPDNLASTGIHIGANVCYPKVECCVSCCDKNDGGALDYLIEANADCFPSSVPCNINDALNADEIMQADCRDSDDCEGKGPYGPEHFEAKVIFYSPFWYITVYRSWLWEEIYSDEGFQEAIQGGNLVTSYGKRIVNGTRCAPIDEDGHELSCYELIAERHVYFENLRLNAHNVPPAGGLSFEVSEENARHHFDLEDEAWVDDLTAYIDDELDMAGRFSGQSILWSVTPDNPDAFNCGKCPILKNDTGEGCSCDGSIDSDYSGEEQEGDSSTQGGNYSDSSDCGQESLGTRISRYWESNHDFVHCYSNDDVGVMQIPTKRVACGGKVQMSFCRGACDYWWRPSRRSQGPLNSESYTETNEYGNNFAGFLGGRRMDAPGFTSLQYNTCQVYGQTYKEVPPLPIDGECPEGWMFMAGRDPDNPEVWNAETERWERASPGYCMRGYSSEAGILGTGGSSGQTWTRMGDYHAYMADDRSFMGSAKDAHAWRLTDYSYHYSSIEIPNSETTSLEDAKTGPEANLDFTVPAVEGTHIFYSVGGNLLGFANSAEHRWAISTLMFDSDIFDGREDYLAEPGGSATLETYILEGEYPGKWEDYIREKKETFEAGVRDRDIGNGYTIDGDYTESRPPKYEFVGFTYSDEVVWPRCREGYVYDKERNTCVYSENPEITEYAVDAVMTGFEYKLERRVGSKYSKFHPWFWGAGYLNDNRAGGAGSAGAGYGDVTVSDPIINSTFESFDSNEFKSQGSKFSHDAHLNSSSKDIVDSITSAGINWYRNSPINWASVNYFGLVAPEEGRTLGEYMQSEKHFRKRGLWINGILGNPACTYDPSWYGQTGGATLRGFYFQDWRTLQDDPGEYMLSTGIFGVQYEMKHPNEWANNPNPSQNPSGPGFDGSEVQKMPLQRDNRRFDNLALGFDDPSWDGRLFAGDEDWEEDTRGDTFRDEFQDFPGSRTPFPVFASARRFGNLYSYFTVQSKSSDVNVNIGKNMYPFNMDFTKPWAGLPVYDKIKEKYKDYNMFMPEIYYGTMSRPEAFILEDSTFMDSGNLDLFNACYARQASNMFDYGLKGGLSDHQYNNTCMHGDLQLGREFIMADEIIRGTFTSSWLPSSRYGPVSISLGID